MPNPTTHFDVVIVGHGFAGLLTAALLSHLQIRVGVVDFDSPEPPCPLPVFGLHSATVVRRVLETCGLWLDVRARLAARPRAVGIALPDRRFRLEPALEARGRELGLAFADAREEMLALMERIAGYGGGLDALLSSDLPLPPRGFAERRAVRRAVREVSASQLVDDPRRWSENRALRAFVGAALAVAGRDDDPDGPMTPGGARALWHLCHGVFGVRDHDSPLDPWAALEAAALVRCAAHGVVVEERRRATRAEVSNTGFEVRLDRGSIWCAAAFVADLDDARLLALFDGNHDAVDAAHGLALEVDAPHAERPRPFSSPLGWVPGPGSRGHVVTDARRHGAPDALRVSAPASVVVQPSPFELLPSIRGEHEVTVAASVPNGDRPPLALFRALPRRVPPQVRRVGFGTVPGLGLESLALSAYQAAQVCERQVRGGSLFDFLLPT